MHIAPRQRGGGWQCDCNLLGHLVTDDATNCGAGTGAGDTAAQDIADHASDDCTCRCAFFLACHSGATAQSDYSCEQQCCAETRRVFGLLFHGVSFEFNMKKYKSEGPFRRHT